MATLYINIQHYLQRYTRRITLLLGSIAVVAWTFIRFFNSPLNFDLVGQQLLAHQWLNGAHGGAIIGPTNYLLKLLFIYIPFDVLPGSTWLKLISMTLLVNIATFLLVVLLLERLWREFYPSVHNLLYMAIGWMTLIAGSMYWIQFTNSRNLELVGGLFLVYSGLCILRRPSVLKYIGFSLFSLLLFFADPLQIYMTLAPLLVFVVVRWLTSTRDKEKFFDIIWLTIAAAVAVGGSKLLVWVVEKLWNISFLVAGVQPSGHSMLATFIKGIPAVFKQIAGLYIGGLEVAKPIEVLNVLLVVGILALGAWYAWRGKIRRELVGLVFSFWIIDICAYIASGQSIQAGTSRYLIMTVPFFVLLFTAVIGVKARAAEFAKYLTIFIIIINIVSLVMIFTKSWNPKFTKNSRVNTAISYMSTHNFAYGFASMETAYPADYLSGGNVTLLPLTCLPSSKVQPARLFFDYTFYKHAAENNAELVPLILDGTAINNNPAICNIANISAQLGQWRQRMVLPDGTTVLLYNAGQLKHAFNL